jgi:hypothetical protein
MFKNSPLQFFALVSKILCQIFTLKQHFSIKVLGVGGIFNSCQPKPAFRKNAHTSNGETETRNVKEQVVFRY